MSPVMLVILYGFTFPGRCINKIVLINFSFRMNKQKHIKAKVGFSFTMPNPIRKHAGYEKLYVLFSLFYIKPLVLSIPVRKAPFHADTRFAGTRKILI